MTTHFKQEKARLRTRDALHAEKICAELDAWVLALEDEDDDLRDLDFKLGAEHQPEVGVATLKSGKEAAPGSRENLDEELDALFLVDEDEDLRDLDLRTPEDIAAAEQDARERRRREEEAALLAELDALDGRQSAMSPAPQPRTPEDVEADLRSEAEALADLVNLRGCTWADPRLEAMVREIAADRQTRAEAEASKKCALETPAEPASEPRQQGVCASPAEELTSKIETPSSPSSPTPSLGTPATTVVITRKASKASLRRTLKTCPAFAELQKARHLARVAQAHNGLAWSCDPSPERQAALWALADPLARLLKDLRRELALADLSGLAYYARLEISPTGKLHAHGVVVPPAGVDPKEFGRRLREPFVRAFGRITRRGAAPHQWKVKPIHEGSGWGNYMLSTQASWLTSRIRKIFPGVKLAYTSQPLTRLAKGGAPAPSAASTATRLSQPRVLAPGGASGTRPRPGRPSTTRLIVMRLHGRPGAVFARSGSRSRPFTSTPARSRPATWGTGPPTVICSTFEKAIQLGLEVIWLHTYGERLADPSQGRPKGAPRMAPGTIPGAPEPLPETMHYDPATRRLHIGKGFVANVPPEVADYEVSGRNVLERWFSYRRRDRTRPVIGDRRPPSPLDAVQPDHWLSDYTDDLLDLLHVLGRLVLLEPAQKDLLDAICTGPLVSAADLDQTGAMTASSSSSHSQAQEAAIGDLFG